MSFQTHPLPAPRSTLIRRCVQTDTVEQACLFTQRILRASSTALKRLVATETGASGCADCHDK